MSTSDGDAVVAEADSGDGGEASPFALFPLHNDQSQHGNEQTVTTLDESQLTSADDQQLSAADLAVPMLLPTTELLLSTADGTENPFAAAANNAESDNNTNEAPCWK